MINTFALLSRHLAHLPATEVAVFRLNLHGLQQLIALAAAQLNYSLSLSAANDVIEANLSISPGHEDSNAEQDESEALFRAMVCLVTIFLFLLLANGYPV